MSGSRFRFERESFPMRWSRVVLILLLVFDVWYRGHTVGPHFRDAFGISLWPAAIGASEPLDCDEAAYAYIGHRILHGDVMYLDLTENKPPLGYWLYTLAVALGGYHELAIRVMPIPFVLATIALVWWIARRLGGPLSAGLAAALFVILSTDPYLFGNGANLEHFINFFAVASLALLIRGSDRTDRVPLVASGICLGAATLVKQVAIVPALIFVAALTWRALRQEDGWRRKIQRGLLDVVSFALGAASILAVAAAILLARGAGAAAYDDIFHYGRALATDTLAEPNAPLGVIRWITGNADPKGQLPWPFGTTNYLVWWGTASWPLWLVSIPTLAYFLVAKHATFQRRLVAAWALAAWAQVILPGLYWPHYYLLPIAGAAITVAVCWADAASVIAHAIRFREADVPSQPLPHPARTEPRPPVSSHSQSDRAVGPRDSTRHGQTRLRPRSILPAAFALTFLTLGIGTTVFLEVRDYLLVPPQELTIRYKGGQQWVVLREMGGEIARRFTMVDDPKLYIWGWQSPLHFYSRLDSPTRHFFVDNLLRDQADRNHPLIEPRTAEIVAALKRRPPELIFTGYPPFRALRSFLNAQYLPARMAPGLWIKRDAFGRFEAPR
jgi:Dolichyl-phosphate-mannose-protein mannosyltransferase